MELYKRYIILLVVLTLLPVSGALAQIKGTVTDSSKGNKNIQIGYGMTRDLDNLTAAVGRMRSTDISKSMVINPTNALYGRIPGLIVLDNGGPPPTSPTLFVRGRSTFSNSNPIILVDGFEWPLSALSVGEIQSITILKDAAALAKYGQRGANGVILVTTKQADGEDFHITASYQQAITQPNFSPDMVGASQYARAVNEARRNDGLSSRYGSADIKAFDSGNLPYLYPNVNWFNKVLRNHGTRSKFNASFHGGGGGRIRYYTSMNMTNDIGLFGPVSRHLDYSNQVKHSRFNFLTNLDIDITNELLFKLGVGGNIVSNNEPSSGGGANQIFSAMYSIPSAAFPIKNKDDSFTGTQIYGNNPIAMLTETGYSQPNSRNFSLTGKLRQDLSNWIEGLNAEAAVSYRNYNLFYESQTKEYSYKSIVPVRNQTGAIVDTTVTKFGQDTDLSYSSAFGQERQFSDIMGKINYQTTVGNTNTLEATVLFHQSSRGFEGQNRTFHRQNAVGNLHYNIDDKYFVEATASYSGNNVLPPGNRFKFFPAISGGWILSKEDFLRGATFLDRLKLRASYGIVGSDQLPANDIYAKKYVYAGGYNFGDGNVHKGGFAQGQLETTDLSDEFSHITDVGIEARFVRKLSLEADFFYAHRTNILVNSSGSISDVIGVGKPLKAEGIVDNKGLEASLLWQDEVGDFAYHIGGQFSYAHNKIINENEQYRQYSYLKRTGHPVGQEFGLQALGFFKNEQDIAKSPPQKFSQVKPGDIKYKDQNNDGVINSDDEVPLGYSSGYPEIYYSIPLGVNYKGVSISALFQGTGHYTAYLYTKSIFRPLINNNTISSYYYNNRWTPETAGSATLPRLTTGGDKNNFRRNSIWLVDRSYIKLRNVQVSYSLPGSITHKLQMNNIHIFVRGRNLFSIDNIPVLNPEQLGAEYPILRSYSAGLKIAF